MLSNILPSVASIRARAALDRPFKLLRLPLFLDDAEDLGRGVLTLAFPLLEYLLHYLLLLVDGLFVGLAKVVLVAYTEGLHPLIGFSHLFDVSGALFELL